MPLLDFVFRLGAALLMGACVGLERQWRQNLDALHLKTNVWNDRLGLYPWPARWLFDRSLHFVARLEVP